METTLTAIPLSDATAPLLSQTFGISVEGIGTGNTISVAHGTRHGGVTLKLAGARDCQITIVQGGPTTATITMFGTGHRCNLNGLGEQGGNLVTATFYGADNILDLGAGSTYVGTQFLIEGYGRAIRVGDDCMFSWGVFCRNYDSHPIFDIETLDQINPPGDLIFGKHVWVGQDAIVMNGSSVGDGSIVGARALVTSPIPDKSLAVGTPARVIRQGVSWVRNQFGGRPDYDAVRAALG